MAYPNRQIASFQQEKMSTFIRLNQTSDWYDELLDKLESVEWHTDSTHKQPKGRYGCAYFHGGCEHPTTGGPQHAHGSRYWDAEEGKWKTRRCELRLVLNYAKRLEDNHGIKLKVLKSKPKSPKEIYTIDYKFLRSLATNLS